MTSLIHMELDKALRNPWFVIALSIALALATASALGNIFFHLNNGVTTLYEHKYVSPSPDSCFGYWISLDYLQPASTLFFQLLPLLAVIPYAWSYRTELQNGYLNQVVSRTPQGRYLLAKGIATFCSGLLVAVVPLLVNFVLLACFIPAYMPDVTEVLYLAVFPDDTASWLFYNVPVLYVLFFTLVAGVLCGLWATFVFGLSLFVDNRVALIVVPFLATLGLQFVSDRIYFALGGINGPNLGLSSNMRAVQETFGTSPWIILAEAVILLLGALVLSRLRLRRDVL